MIGAGPAGLIAAGRAASCGAPVILLEKNESPGRKLLITGAGRCNVTTADDKDAAISRFFGQGRFLYPAFSQFYRPELLDLLAQHGTPCRVDHQGKFFPVSDRASDVLDALLRFARSNGVQIRTQVTVTGIELRHADRGPSASDIAAADQPVPQPEGFLIRTNRGDLKACAVILATGGQTYQATGSTGDGYQLAKQLGLPVTRIRPALVPLLIREPYIPALAGLSLPDVAVTLLQDGQKPARDRGDLLLTHRGVSGPVILRLSRDLVDQGQLVINLQPSARPDELAATIQKTCAAHPRQQLKNCLDSLIPHRLAEPLLLAAGLPVDCQAAQVGRVLAERMAHALQNWTLQVSGQAGQHLAMVTAGGIDLKAVKPGTLGARQIPGLYFAGEVLDLDGDTGGYNLQAAFSTGWLAGESAAADWHAQQ